MNIKILNLIEGAKEAKGVAVIIDVFRAFSVECYIMDKKPKVLYACGDKTLAYNYKNEHKDALLVGERHGVMLEGFNYGNSPSQLENADLYNKTIIHTTSAGTQGIENAINADVILTGSLVNAKAIAEYIKRNRFKEVSLVGMGIETLYEAEEDTLCALYIKSLLEDKPLLDMDERIEHLKSTTGKKFFDPLQQNVFPKDDFRLSTDLNRFNFVLKVERRADGLNIVKRIDL